MKKIILFSFIIVISFLVICIPLGVRAAKNSLLLHPTIITSDNSSQNTMNMTEQSNSSDPPVTIQNMQFMPQSLDVTAGSTVTWTNRDSIAHTTTADNMSAAEHWDSGILSPGQSFSKTFNTPGTYSYHCNIHPFMHGTIVVTRNSTQPTSTATPRVTSSQTSTPTIVSPNTLPQTGYPSTTTTPSSAQNVNPSTTTMPITTTTYTTQPQVQTNMQITCPDGSNYSVEPNQDMTSICPSIVSTEPSQSQSQKQAQSANSSVDSGGFSIQIFQSQTQSQTQNQP